MQKYVYSSLKVNLLKIEILTFFIDLSDRRTSVATDQEIRALDLKDATKPKMSNPRIARYLNFPNYELFTQCERGFLLYFHLEHRGLVVVLVIVIVTFYKCLFSPRASRSRSL